MDMDNYCPNVFALSDVNKLNLIDKRSSSPPKTRRRSSQKKEEKRKKT